MIGNIELAMNSLTKLIANNFPSRNYENVQVQGVFTPNN